MGMTYKEYSRWTESCLYHTYALTHVSACRNTYIVLFPDKVYFQKMEESDLQKMGESEANVFLF